MTVSRPPRQSARAASHGQVSAWDVDGGVHAHPLRHHDRATALPRSHSWPPFPQAGFGRRHRRRRGVNGLTWRLFVDIAPTLPGRLARHSELYSYLRPRFAPSARDANRLQLSMFQRPAHCADVRQGNQRAVAVARTTRVTTQPGPRLPTFVPSVAEIHPVRLP